MRPISGRSSTPQRNDNTNLTDAPLICWCPLSVPIETPAKKRGRCGRTTAIEGISCADPSLAAVSNIAVCPGVSIQWPSAPAPSPPPCSIARKGSVLAAVSATVRKGQCLGHAGSGNTGQRQCLSRGDSGNTGQRQCLGHESSGNARQMHCLTCTPPRTRKPWIPRAASARIAAGCVAGQCTPADTAQWTATAKQGGATVHETGESRWRSPGGGSGGEADGSNR